MNFSTLDNWTAKKTGLGDALTPSALAHWHHQALRRQAQYAIANSPFWRDLYADADLDAPQTWPLISERTLQDAGNSMLCLPQSRVLRVISMATSGSTGKPKRVYFSAADIDLTVAFFAHGLTTFTLPKERIFICMNQNSTDSLGNLLTRAAQRTDMQPLLYGDITDYEDALKAAEEFNPNCIAGHPQQILRLAEHSPTLRPRTVLLSADTLPEELRLRVSDLWRTEVFDHWGMRETGLGGALECRFHEGYHIRHADIYLEIIDPQTGEILPDGENGELVLSTLNREAMPLLRYRTGDITRLIHTECLCGSKLKRLGQIQRTSYKQHNS